MLISNFGFGGFIGEKIAEFLFWIFGWVAFISPFLLFGTVAFLVSNRGNGAAYLKTVLGVVLTVLVCTLLELIHRVGGLIGKAFTTILTPAIGVAGTYVVVPVSYTHLDVYKRQSVYHTGERGFVAYIDGASGRKLCEGYG